MRIAAGLLAFVVVLGSSWPVLANDLQRFRMKVEKSAPDEVVPSPPVICVCKDTERLNYVGQLVSSVPPPPPLGGAIYAVIRVTCIIPTFYFEGPLTGGSVSCDVWELLPK